MLCDFIQRRRSAADNFSRKLIGIDNIHAQILKARINSGLATPDSASKSNYEHSNPQ
jgi:hypothetical protein